MSPTPAPRGAISRRDFVKAVTAAAAGSALPAALYAVVPRRAPPFEISASTYAWEVHDEGVEVVLQNLQTMAAVNSVYLIGIMHPERRPFRNGTFPHNPVRQTWQAEDARCYWHPDPARYGRVKPRLSDFDWLRDTDWLQVVADASRRRGLKVGAEISHVVIDVERMEGEFADLQQRTIHGEPTRVRAQFRPPCPNHPDMVAYVHALGSELVARYDVDYMMSCLITYDDGGPDRGGCFCGHCERVARDLGHDLPKIRAALLANVQDEAAIRDWRDFRYRATARFYAGLHARLHALKPGIDLRYNAHMTRRNPLDWGMNLPLLRPHLDSLRLMDYTEQEGDPALMPGKRDWLTKNRTELGPDFSILSALGVRLQATPELIREGVRIAVETGMDGVTLGHYDGATFPILRAVRDGLAAAGVELPAT